MCNHVVYHGALLATFEHVEQFQPNLREEQKFPRFLHFYRFCEVLQVDRRIRPGSVPCHGKDMESAAGLDPGNRVQRCTGTLYMQGVCVGSTDSTHMHQTSQNWGWERWEQEARINVVGEVFKGRGHQCGNWLTCCFLLFQDLYLDRHVFLNSGKKS